MQLLHMCFTSMELLLRGLPPLIVTSVSSLSLLSEKVYVECGVSFLVDVLTYESLVCLVDISSTTHVCLGGRYLGQCLISSCIAFSKTFLKAYR